MEILYNDDERGCEAERLEEFLDCEDGVVEAGPCIEGLQKGIPQRYTGQFRQERSGPSKFLLQGSAAHAFSKAVPGSFEPFRAARVSVEETGKEPPERVKSPAYDLVGLQKDHCRPLGNPLLQFVKKPRLAYSSLPVNGDEPSRFPMENGFTETQDLRKLLIPAGHSSLEKPFGNRSGVFGHIQIPGPGFVHHLRRLVDPVTEDGVGAPFAGTHDPGVNRSGGYPGLQIADILHDLPGELQRSGPVVLPGYRGSEHHQGVNSLFVAENPVPVASP